MLIGLTQLLFLSTNLHVPKLEDAVLYEANLRAEGPHGGFASLTKRLDSIRALGVNVLWLMPVFPVGRVRSAGGLGSPYSVADYESLNPEFGTPDEFRHLVFEAHRRKMSVILDWVANHTSWDHPWLTSHPEWYTHDSKGNITIPAGTNWKDVADLNYGNSAMRRAMVDSMRQWVDRFSIDGFRMDAADFVPFEFWNEAISRLRKGARRPLLFLAEGARADHYRAGFDLTFGWNFYQKLRDIYNGAAATGLAEVASREAKEIPSGARRLRFITNHDFAAWEGTPTDFFKSSEGVRTSFVISALYGGVPLIYSGQEVAWPKRIPIFYRSKIDWDKNPGTRKWISSLMLVRRGHESAKLGSCVDFSSADVIAFSRRSSQDEILVFGNVRGKSSLIKIPQSLRGRWQEYLSKRFDMLPSWLELPAFSYRVFMRRK